MTEISFGEYYDAQRDRLRKMMDHRGGGAWQAVEWMEAYEKRKKNKIL